MNTLNNKLELLSKNDLSELCNLYSINNKIYTYNDSNKLIKTNIICCKYDMIELINSFLSSTKKQIIYYNFLNSKKPYNKNTNITFKNINSIRQFICKYYKKTYNIEFDYDKTTYVILNKYWSLDNPISVNKFCDIYFTTTHNNFKTYITKNNILPQLITEVQTPEINIEQVKTDIKSYIDEYMILNNIN